MPDPAHPTELALPTRTTGVVDETLLDLLASLTPEERLRRNDRAAAAILELRHGFEPPSLTTLLARLAAS